MQPTEASTATKRGNPAPLPSCLFPHCFLPHKLFCEYSAVLGRLKKKSFHLVLGRLFCSSQSLTCHLTAQIFVLAQRWGSVEATETTAFLAAVICTDFFKSQIIHQQQCCSSRWGLQALFQDLCHTMTQQGCMYYMQYCTFGPSKKKTTMGKWSANSKTARVMGLWTAQMTGSLHIKMWFSKICVFSQNSPNCFLCRLVFLFLKLHLVGAPFRRKQKKKRNKRNFVISLLNSYFILVLPCLFHSLVFQQ